MSMEDMHVAVRTAAPFDEVVRRLESAIGKDKFQEYSQIVASTSDWNEFQQKISTLVGSSGFMEFLEVNHGQWMTLTGAHLKSKMYVIGNPLIAQQVLPHNPATGLYVPVRISVYEEHNEQNQTCISYDRPSALFEKFEDERIGAVGRLLDSKLAALASWAAFNQPFAA